MVLLQDIERIVLSNNLTIRKLHYFIKKISDDEFVNTQTVEDIIKNRVYKINYSYHCLNIEISLFINLIEYDGLDTRVKIKNILAYIY